MSDWAHEMSGWARRGIGAARLIALWADGVGTAPVV